MCQSCREAMEIKFQEVKEYIRAHKGVSIPEVSKACDVDPNYIRQWLREDRLEVTEDSAIYLTCESCGGPIRSGRFCEKCKAQMTSDLRSVMQDSQPVMQKRPKPGTDEGNPRMRFL